MVEPTDDPTNPSFRHLPTVSGKERSQTAVASWRDAGQWPYGTGAGQPESARSEVPTQYPAAYAAPAEKPNPATVAGRGARETGAGHASRPAQVSYDDYDAPRAGLNQTMALNSPGSRLPPTGDTETGYGDGSQPANVYPEAAPVVGTPIAERPTDGTPIVGTPIPGSFRERSDGVGHYGNRGQEGPGIARLQGVIEKSSVRTTYDSTRPSVY